MQIPPNGVLNANSGIFSLFKTCKFDMDLVRGAKLAHRTVFRCQGEQLHVKKVV